MTQPVQEPSQGRTDQGLEFRSRQLFRRPAPPASGYVYHNPTIQYVIKGPDFAWYNEDAFQSGFSYVADLTAPLGGYYESSTAQNNYMIVGCPLGPAGSRWTVDLWWGSGADYGDIDFEWQTTSVDVPGSTSEFVAEPVTSDPWYKSDTTKTLVTGYNAVTIDTYDTQLGGIIPNGADGDMLSADGTASAFTYRYMNGGGDASVWWWLRLKSTTKDAASTGYRMRIHGLRIRRTVESGWSPL